MMSSDMGELKSSSSLSPPGPDAKMNRFPCFLAKRPRSAMSAMERTARSIRCQIRTSHSSGRSSQWESPSRSHGLVLSADTSTSRAHPTNVPPTRAPAVVTAASWTSGDVVASV